MQTTKIWSGFGIGLICGGIIAVFLGPRWRLGHGKTAWINRMSETGTNLRKTMKPKNTVEDSLQDGKLMAHQRRQHQTN